MLKLNLTFKDIENLAGVNGGCATCPHPTCKGCPIARTEDKIYNEYERLKSERGL